MGWALRFQKPPVIPTGALSASRLSALLPLLCHHGLGKPQLHAFIGKLPVFDHSNRKVTETQGNPISQEELTSNTH